MRAGALRERLERDPPMLLDGALGTELERAGIASSLPLWTTHALLNAPESVERIHRSYADAGAEVLTAGTFRTQARTLSRSGPGEDPAQIRRSAAELTKLAIALARAAAAPEPDDHSRHAPLVAGSASPLEDCYRPDLVPPGDALEREHREHADNIVAAGADLILVETMNSAREAAAAAAAARATGLPFLVSFVCGRDGTLLSGEPLQAGIDAVRGVEPIALSVNCTPPSVLDRCLPVLRDCGLVFGVYPNLGEPIGQHAYREETTPAQFARLARSWIAEGASLVGGCCGTGPEHIRALALEIAG